MYTMHESVLDKFVLDFRYIGLFGCGKPPRQIHVRFWEYLLFPWKNRGGASNKIGVIKQHPAGGAHDAPQTSKLDPVVAFAPYDSRPGLRHPNYGYLIKVHLDKIYYMVAVYDVERAPKAE